VDTSKPLAVALLVILALIQPMHGTIGQDGSQLPVGLGFNQSSVAPVGAGVPVYTVGDQLWFRSYTTGVVNVTVTPPESGSGQSFIVSSNIPGNTSEYLFAFSDTDTAGAWTLMASTSTQEVTIQFYLVSGGAPAVLSGYDVGAGGLLAMNYTLASTSAYDVSACTAGSQSTATVYVPVPTALGGGTLLLTLDGTSVSVIPQGSMSPFTFWLGLSQNYAYQLNDSLTAVVSKSTEVAQTEPVQVLGGVTGSFSTALHDDLPMRTGEFTLSANFEGSQGLSVHDTPVLVTGTGVWVWLQGCSEAANPLSTTVTVTASLQTGPSLWPRYVYMIYQQLGVELFSVAPVQVQPAAVEMVAPQWGDQPLTDSQIEVSGASQYAAGNGTVYLVGPQYPLQVSVATPQIAPQLVEVAQPYSETQVQVQADQIVVSTLSGGMALSGVEVTLEDSNGTVARETSAGGVAVFYVPPGNFTVLGTLEGVAESSGVTIHEATAAGQSLRVTLQFGGGSPSTLTYLLLVALGIGILINGIAWATVYRRRRDQLAPKALRRSFRVVGGIVCFGLEAGEFGG
jgi:hypothetical protein